MKALFKLFKDTFRGMILSVKASTLEKSTMTAIATLEKDLHGVTLNHKH